MWALLEDQQLQRVRWVQEHQHLPWVQSHRSLPWHQADHQHPKGLEAREKTRVNTCSLDAALITSGCVVISHS